MWCYLIQKFARACHGIVVTFEEIDIIAQTRLLQNSAWSELTPVKKCGCRNFANFQQMKNPV